MTDPDNALHSLSLDARQRAMLEAMGIRDWWPEPATPPAEPALSTQPTTTQPLATPTAPAPAQAQARTAVASPAGLKPPQNEEKTIAFNPSNKSDKVDFYSKNGTDLAAMGWDALTARIHACQACNLCKGRQQAVPGMGNPTARWMIVGEAPGEQEDKQGLPFVGPAGQLLDAMLAAMGLNRDDDVYIANVIKCRPPRNRNPEPEEIAHCLPYLQRQIELVQPDMLLALGRFAAQALLQGTVPDVDKQPLGRLRGQVYTVNRRPLVVSYHPAYLLRNPVEKGKVWADLCLAMAHLGHNPLAERAARATAKPAS